MTGATIEMMITAVLIPTGDKHEANNNRARHTPAVGHIRANQWLSNLSNSIHCMLKLWETGNRRLAWRAGERTGLQPS